MLHPLRNPGIRRPTRRQPPLGLASPSLREKWSPHDHSRVVESATPDEREHLAFAHGFGHLWKHMVNDEAVEPGPRVCRSNVDGHTFGERWERVNSRQGRRMDQGSVPRIGRDLYSGIAGAAPAGTGISAWTETATPVTDLALWFPFLQCWVCQAAMTAAKIGRLNDKGRAPWLSALCFVPVANFCLAFWAAFATLQQDRTRS